MLVNEGILSTCAHFNETPQWIRSSGFETCREDTILGFLCLIRYYYCSCSHDSKGAQIDFLPPILPASDWDRCLSCDTYSTASIIRMTTSRCSSDPLDDQTLSPDKQHKQKILWKNWRKEFDWLGPVFSLKKKRFSAWECNEFEIIFRSHSTNDTNAYKLAYNTLRT